jgi:hypothetical protein
MQKFDKIISLGYICSLSNTLKPTHPNMISSVFDNIATPMWAVYDLIQNNFDDFLSSGNMESRVLFDGTNEQFLIDKQYYTRVIYKNMDAGYEKFRVRTLQRAQEFLSVLHDLNEKNGTILFIRQEEPTVFEDRGNRIMQPEFVAKYAQTEVYYLQQMSLLLKQRYPLLKFKILFISCNNPGAEDIVIENEILSVYCQHFDYRSPISAAQYASFIEIKKEFLETNLITEATL